MREASVEFYPHGTVTSLPRSWLLVFAIPLFAWALWLVLVCLSELRSILHCVVLVHTYLFEIYRYADIVELKALARLVGPYGVKLIEREVFRVTNWVFFHLLMHFVLVIEICAFQRCNSA